MLIESADFVGLGVADQKKQKKNLPLVFAFWRGLTYGTRRWKDLEAPC